jgi:hypothetical protein
VENSNPGSILQSEFHTLQNHLPCDTELISKAKAVPLHATEALGGRRYSSYSLSTSALGGREWSASRSGCALAPGKGQDAG